MKKETHFGDRILWIGDKAAETYRKTNKSVLEQFNNQILLYENKTKEAPEKNVTYLKDLRGNENLEYDAGQLKEALKSFIQTENAADADLLIGSSFELLFQQLLESYKAGRTTDKKKNFTNEMLFSYSLSREMDTSSKKTSDAKKVLFLHQEVPFKDMLMEARLTMESARKKFTETFTTKSSETDISEFLFRLTDEPTSKDHTNEIEKL
jgi:hypothetical protein